MSKFWATGSSSSSSSDDSDCDSDSDSESDSDSGSNSNSNSNSDIYTDRDRDRDRNQRDAVKGNAGVLFGGDHDDNSTDTPLAAKGGGGFSTPPRQYILPVDDPHSAWERARIDQAFIPEPTRSGPPCPMNYTRIVCMSDTHGYHRDIEVPRGDVLVHGGDFTNFGELKIIEDVSHFFAEISGKSDGGVGVGRVGHVICIAGNHELTFQPEHYSRVWRKFHHPKDRLLNAERAREALKNCTYLEDMCHEHGGVLYYGSPWQPEFFDWAYNKPRNEIVEKWLAIPDDTDVLVTHGPPLGRGDVTGDRQRVGCVELMTQVQRRIKPRLHLFGHIHEGYGVSFDGTTLYVNGSNVCQNYTKRNPCVVVDLPHDRSLPAMLVIPVCDFDAGGVINWMRGKGHGTLVPHFEGVPPPGVSGRNLLDAELFSEVCCRIGIHRHAGAMEELNRAISKLRAESYG